MLSELINQENRDAVLRIGVGDISADLVDKIIGLVDNNKGKHSLVVNITDHLNKYEVDVLSRKYKVDLNKDFIGEVNNLNQVQLKVLQN